MKPANGSVHVQVTGNTLPKPPTRGAGARAHTGLILILLLSLVGCEAGRNQATLESNEQEPSKEERLAAEKEAERLRDAAVNAELARLERERLENLAKVEKYKREQELLAQRKADLAALRKEAERLAISTVPKTPVGGPNIGNGATPVTPVVDAQHLLFAQRCDKTLRIIEELKAGVQITVSDMERLASGRVKSASGSSPEFYKLQLEKFYGFQDTLDLLTENIKNLKSQAYRNDTMVHLDKELMNRIETLQTVKDSIPERLVAAAEQRAAADPSPAGQRAPKPSEPLKPPAPRKPKKTYTLTDGRVLDVLSEIVAGDEVIVKTVKGEILNIRKGDIEKEEKHK